MSRFLSSRLRGKAPYVPGEQLHGGVIKLNTNENPFPPSPKAISFAAEAAKTLARYPDPNYRALCAAFADEIGVRPENVVPANGSDEILDMIFNAFCGDGETVFPDVTYGFYRVFANKYGIKFTEIPLDGEMRIDPDDYTALGKNIFIANPNAPTGKTLSPDAIERIVSTNRDNIVVIDEAYVDFGGTSAVGMINKYDNLIVTRTFSKSRSMAGARLGFGVACGELIKDLNALRFSTNPYNLDSCTVAAGLGSLADRDYFESNLKTVRQTRDEFICGLRRIGFEADDSDANFVFAKHKALSGEEIYKGLRSKGILVRYFDAPRTREYVRVTVGTKEAMAEVLNKLKEITEGER